MAYNVAEKTQQKHPFKDGRGWLDGYKTRHPKLTLCTPQLLSYCRALCSNKETINDSLEQFIIYGRLNLLSKPMQVFNADETGVNIVHKPGKVVAKLGCHNVYSLTSAERGKNHTILSCVSAAGYALPPSWCIYVKRQCLTIQRKVLFRIPCFGTVKVDGSTLSCFLNGSSFSFKISPQPDLYC